MTHVSLPFSLAVGQMVFHGPSGRLKRIVAIEENAQHPWHCAIAATDGRRVTIHRAYELIPISLSAAEKRQWFSGDAVKMRAGRRRIGRIRARPLALPQKSG